MLTSSDFRELLNLFEKHINGQPVGYGAGKGKETHGFDLQSVHGGIKSADY